ncbi:hypothetical protein WKK05_06805 [Nostoc sp. UHCC 0302]|uniref:hypothetical protein n=1 Tax=Nostoc sp. UHCC 0302 TaxID=3134896 RepID=UPI00311CA74F
MAIELKDFRKTLSYAIQAPVANVIADLYKIEEINTISELKQKEYANKALYYLLGIVGLFILFMIVGNISLDKGLQALIVILLFLAFIILVIAGIYALVKRYKFNQLKISFFRSELTKKIVQMLSRDMDQSALIDLQLSFQPIERKENKINTIKHPNKPGWNIDNYEDTWLKVQGQFLDKTRFELSTSGICKRQYGWKTGRSGKSKHKSKTKFLGLDINLSLTYPQRRYGAVKILKNEVNDAIILPDLTYLKGLKVTEKAMHISVRISPQIAEEQEAVYQTVTAMFLSLYQVLNLAKILSK